MFLAALPRVAGLPVGDLARLAAVAAFLARATDGEGGVGASRESAADVAHPSTYPSISGALLSMTAFPMTLVTLHAAVKSGAARPAASEGRRLVRDCLIAISTNST